MAGVTISKIESLSAEGTYSAELSDNTNGIDKIDFTWARRCVDADAPTEKEIEGAELALNRAELFAGVSILNKEDAIKMLLRASCLPEANSVNVVRIEFLSFSRYLVTFDKFVPKLRSTNLEISVPTTHHESFNPSGRIVRIMREEIEKVQSRLGCKISNFDSAVNSLILATDR